MKKLYLLLLVLLSSMAYGQSVKFRPNEDNKKVFKGQTVEIVADSAYVISGELATRLNEQQSELNDLKERFANVNSSLTAKITELQGLVNDLMERMESQAEDNDVDLEAIVASLNETIADLQQNNQNLADNNATLEAQITKMKKTIKLLRKELRGIWWNGIMDKIITGTIGIAIGYLLGAS